MEKQEFAQMMEQILAKWETKWEADRKADHEEMMARMDVMHKQMLAGMDASYKKMTAWGETFDAWSTDTNDNGEETVACQEKTEVRLEEEEPTSVDRTPEVAQEREVPREDAVEMPVGEPRKRRRDQ
jgi:hypothetical protein